MSGTKQGRRPAWLALLALCGCARACGPEDPRFAAAIVAEPIKILGQDPTLWEAALRRLEYRFENVPESKGARLISTLAAHALPMAKLDDACDQTFIGTRVRESLLAIQAELLDKPLTADPVAPKVCSTLPVSLPSTLAEGKVVTLRFTGWDLNALQSPGLKLIRISPAGVESDVSASLRFLNQAHAELDWGGGEIGPSAEQETGALSLRAGEAELARVPITRHAPLFEPTLSEVNSPPAQHPHVLANVPPDHVLIGGGCFARWREEGLLLTGSFPTPQGWACAAKDHWRAEIGSVTAYALSLPRSLALQVVTSSASGRRANHPTARATLPPGYVLIGGGCNIDYGRGPGNLVVASAPSDEGWLCSGKDHFDESPGVATAFAIGLRLPAGQERVMVQAVSALDNHPRVSAGLPMDSSILLGGGCSTEYSASGNLLWASAPRVSANGWFCAGKDHRGQDRATITVTAIGLRPIPETP